MQRAKAVFARTWQTTIDMAKNIVGRIMIASNNVKSNLYRSLLSISTLSLELQSKMLEHLHNVVEDRVIISVYPGESPG
jgi:hypothetical protein